MRALTLALSLVMTGLTAQDTPTIGQDPDAWFLRPGDFVARVDQSDGEVTLTNGLISRTWRIADDNVACVGFEDRIDGRSLLRAVRPEAVVSIDGERSVLGGLEGQPNHAYLDPEWVEQMSAPESMFRLAGMRVVPVRERMAWKRVRHTAGDVAWPPSGRGLEFRFENELGFCGCSEAEISIVLHYEIYDGVPAIAKWLEVRNESEVPHCVDSFRTEELAIVEEVSRVETREGVPVPAPTGLMAFTDFAFGGFGFENANRHVVHWRNDPAFTSQVNYLKQTPCLLVVEPTYGPAQDLAPGESFETYTTFELVQPLSYDRERRGLAIRKLYRTIAPWVTENPLMMHMRNSDPERVRAAIDQCAEVGFEMLILSFGSGFNIENKDPEYLGQWREIVAYGAERGVEVGGYSLLSSRRIGGGNDIVPPEGQKATHGNCPALTSEWGLEYMRTLRSFFETTGMTLLEHDGPYPGDIDTTPRPPLQKGVEDSRWVQWRIVDDFYRWCREQGIYVNAPDHYFLNGTNKCGMGYREVNWSLPRAQQVIHTRQNIFDGTWDKTPSMGWMFVPLTQYHGGGAAATIEPLDQHRDHYRRMLESNLLLGVQACYRGPRLYDTDATKELVKSQVGRFKRWRDLLEADVIHGRRADGRELDWMIHAAPRREAQQAMVVVFNPRNEDRTATIRLDLRLAGFRAEQVTIFDEQGTPTETLEIGADGSALLPVTVPAGVSLLIPLGR